MGKLTRVMAAAGRGAMWLLPAGRRDWVAAIGAEAHEVRPGLARLAWRSGGVWVLAREALMPRRLGRALLFAVAAAFAAWAAWPQPGVGHAAESQFHVIATVLLLAGMPLLARRFFGPASPGRAGRSLRVFCYAAILACMPAVAIVEAFANLTPAQPVYRYAFCIAQGWSSMQGCGGVPGRSTGGPPWEGEIPILLLTIAYLGVYEMHAATGVPTLMLIAFPVIGLFTSSVAAAIANPAPRQSGPQPGGGGGGGGDGPEPEPGSPGDGPRADRVPVLVLSIYGERAV